MEEKSIAEDSLLETDLGIYGADAMEHMVAFGKHFSVDVSKFMAAEYFSAEGGLKLPPWLAKLFKVQEQPRQKELSIRHLMKAVEARRLDEEVINSK